MAAGLGFKTFTTGEVLTAGDTNGYLMQGINVFASAAARDAAITSPQEGQFAFTKDTNGLWYYDGAAWVASGATGDIEGVTAGVGISGGGTSGTVTVTNSMATAIDAKGDLVPGTGADTFARLAVGANDTVLTADSTEATGMKWATPAGGGGMTSIASGSLSGATLDLTSIPSTYNDLRLVLRGFSNDNDAGYITSRVNATASIYANLSAFSDTGSSIAASNIELMGGTAMDADIGNPGSSLIYDIYDYASTTSLKQFRSRITYFNTTGTRNLFMIEGAIKTNSAISAIRLSMSSGNFDSGTYILYGVK